MPNEQLFSYIMMRESYIQWIDDDVCFALDQHAKLIYMLLAHCNNSLQLEVSLHCDTFFWFRAKMFLLLHLKAGHLAEEQQIPI